MEETFRPTSSRGRQAQGDKNLCGLCAFARTEIVHQLADYYLRVHEPFGVASPASSRFAMTNMGFIRVIRGKTYFFINAVFNLTTLLKTNWKSRTKLEV